MFTIELKSNGSPIGLLYGHNTELQGTDGIRDLTAEDIDRFIKQIYRQRSPGRGRSLYFLSAEEAGRFARQHPSAAQDYTFAFPAGAHRRSTKPLPLP